MAEISKKRRFLVGVVQVGALIIVIATIFFTVPAMNKVAQRKTTSSSTKNTASSSNKAGNSTSTSGASGSKS